MDFMETPLPFEDSISEEELENPKQEITFFIKSNKNNNFKISIANMDSYLLLNAQIKVDFNNIIYERQYFYNELIKNKYLYICDSIDEIFGQLKLELKKKI